MTLDIQVKASEGRVHHIRYQAYAGHAEGPLASSLQSLKESGLQSTLGERMAVPLLHYPVLPGEGAESTHGGRVGWGKKGRKKVKSLFNSTTTKKTVTYWDDSNKRALESLESSG